MRSRMLTVGLWILVVAHAACASSGVSVVEVKMKPRPGVTLSVLPFKVQGAAEVAQDWRKTGEVVATPERKKVETGM